MKASQETRTGTGLFDEAGAAQMDRTAAGIFAPVYPLLASQIVSRLGIKQGLCVDIGSGPGSLALALARVTTLRVILLDAAMPMHRRAGKHLAASGDAHRFALLCGDVHRIPIRDRSVDLAVSRGSVFFWERPEDAFREIHRILAPSGRSYIGGGFGNAALRDRICEQMGAVRPGWRAFRDRNFGKPSKQKFISALEAAATPYDLIDNDSGFWIVIRKE